jgi:membrane fusion protein (multidrug efflux system)
MANGEVFKESGRVNVIEAEFNNETGTIPFRADFRIQMACSDMAETGNIQMNKLVKGAILIPQKATFESSGPPLCFRRG